MLQGGKIGLSDDGNLGLPGILSGYLSVPYSLELDRNSLILFPTFIRF